MGVIRYRAHSSKSGSDEDAAVVKHGGPVYFVNISDLQPLQSRPGFITYCRQLWARRHFILADAKAKALRTTKDYRLWRVWLVLQPVLDVAFYGFLFGFLLKTAHGVENFPGFLILGVIFMRMMVALLTQGSMLLRNSRAMMQTFQFPRASLVISQALRTMFDNVLPAIVALVMALVFQLDKPLNWTIVFVVPLFFLIHIFGTGLMFFSARLTAEIPDTRAIINFLSQAWFFLSGVMFSVDRFVDHPIVREFMTANPGYIFLTAIRDSVLYGEVPSLNTWAILLAWTFGTFAAGLIYFWAAEEKYVRIS